MKKNIRKYMINGLINNGLILLVLFSFSIQKGYGQEDSEPDQEAVKKISPILKLISDKYDDNNRTITSIFSYKDKEKKEFYKVKGVPLTFYITGDSLINLGTYITNEDGMAVCEIKQGIELPKNEEGIMHFTVEFEGNDIFEAIDNDLDVIDLDLEMELGIIDSVKTVSVKAQKILADNEKTPLTEVEIPVYVQRMFSQLKIGDVYLDEGEGTFEFPNDIPGDTLGMLTVIVKYDEHEEFANVRKSKSIDWGIVTSHHTIYHPRSLWTQVAPIWMIITLSIMLLGVWGHYLYVIIQMVKLKKGSKESKGA